MKLNRNVEVPIQIYNYIKRYNRVEWLAFKAGIRDTILVDLSDLSKLRLLMEDEDYYIQEYANENVLVSRTPIEIEPTDDLRRDYGFFLKYPEFAIDDLVSGNLSNPKLVCWDYKIFAVSSEKTELALSLPYEHCLFLGGYKDAMKRFERDFNIATIILYLEN